MVHHLPELGIVPTMLRLADAVLPEMTLRLTNRLGPQIDIWGRKFTGQTIPLGPSGNATIKTVRLTRPYLPRGRLFEVGLTPEVELA